MPPTGPQLSEDTVEGLAERIEMRQPMAAYTSYQKIVESGCHASEFFSAYCCCGFHYLNAVNWMTAVASSCNKCCSGNL